MHLSTKQKFTILDALSNESKDSNGNRKDTIQKAMQELKQNGFKNVSKYNTLINKSISDYYDETYRSTVPKKNRILRSLKNIPNIK